MPLPTKLETKDGTTLVITWSDSSRREYSFRELREACPCATCREKRNAPPAAPGLLTILSPAEARPLSIQGMKPVGNYAYSIDFSDGHDTGIFTFEFLGQLGKQVESQPTAGDS